MDKYIEGVMNYTGSKYKLLPQILPEMNYTKPYFVDLFCGGGSVYTNVVDKYDKILANDDKPCILLEKLISDGFNYKELEFDYNKVSRKGNKDTKEVIIKNYQ